MFQKNVTVPASLSPILCMQKDMINTFFNDNMEPTTVLFETVLKTKEATKRTFVNQVPISMHTQNGLL